MRTRSHETSLTSLPLSQDSEVPLYIQLAEGVEQAIANGTLNPGQQIPATRVLMQELSVSRNTARAAVNRLIHRGLLISRPGSGVYVAAPKAYDLAPASTPENPENTTTELLADLFRDLPSNPLPSPASNQESPMGTPLPVEPAALPAARPLSFHAPDSRPVELKSDTPTPIGTAPGSTARTGSIQTPPQNGSTRLDPPRLESVPIHRAAILPQVPLNQLSAFPTVRPFRPGLGDHREFPLSLWERLRTRVVKDFNVDLLGPEDPAGHAPLREAIVRYLAEVRGVQCTADQVFLTSGLAETIQVVTTALMPPDGVVAMEEPGHLHAKAAFLAAGARLMPLLVDEEGALPPHARRKNPPYLLFVTPGHQFPLSAPMSLPRRLGLLEFVQQTGAMILEDDYDREFLDQRDLPATVHSLDRGRSTLYTFSFSKLLFSSLRLSVVVVPTAYTELFLRAMAVVSGPKPAIDQATLALFLKEGHFLSHIRYLRTIYQSRLKTVRECFAADLKGVLELEATLGGLHAIGWLERGWDEREVTCTALAAGIDLMPLGSFGKTALLRPAVVVGLAAWQDDEIRRATARLALALGLTRGSGLAMSATPTGA